MAHRLSQDPRSDPLSDLRFSLEIMPGSRKFVFNASARAEILTKLNASLMGSNQRYFLPKGVSNVPQHQLLSEYQASIGFGGAGKGEPVVEGRPCSHIFKKGETCYRCKDCALDDSCVMCARCFHASGHAGHTISFFISTQSGGCCDCGDEEAWRHNINCEHHPYTSSTGLPEVPPGPLPDILPSVSPTVQTLPQPLKDSMHRTIAFAVDFILDVLDYSPDEASIPVNEADLRLQPSADPMMKDMFCLVLWNDDKHSYDEVKTVIMELSGKGSGPEREREVDAMVRKLEDEGRVMVDMNVINTNPSTAMHGHHHGKLLEMGLAMAQIDLGVTIRRAYDTFCEQAAAVILEWLLDITRARVGTDQLVLREVLAAEFLLPRRRDAFGFGLSNKGAAGMILPISAATIKEVPTPTRLDYMFVYHGKLWKRLRLSLKEIYASIISLSRIHKLTIGECPALLLNRTIESFPGSRLITLLMCCSL
ncbi:putative zinc finger in N-recognin-domain-containing protein [Ephemerocybe angulata]|uniref:E3 ubiquitin-protein ligase n=1 Tax=Ephemerocybe angulata TaxID=980116 RepID=A0A8H6I4L3_9AGAR|nr:putative zinc finger in N-recognin-domain-containing protein [Tulosesus angulatus]